MIAFCGGAFAGWQPETARWWLVLISASVAWGIAEAVYAQIEAQP